MNYYGGRGRGNGGRGGYGRQNQQRERRDNDGALFLNNKRTSDKAPTFRGQCMVAGRSYWISAWEKQDRNGDPMFSLAFEPKDEGLRQAPERPAEGRQRSFADQAPRQPHPSRLPDRQPRFENIPPPHGEDDYGAEPPFDDEIPF